MRRIDNKRGICVEEEAAKCHILEVRHRRLPLLTSLTSLACGESRRELTHGTTRNVNGYGAERSSAVSPWELS